MRKTLGRPKRRKRIKLWEPLRRWKKIRSWAATTSKWTTPRSKWLVKQIGAGGSHGGAGLAVLASINLLAKRVFYRRILALLLRRYSRRTLSIHLGLKRIYKVQDPTSIFAYENYTNDLANGQWHKPLQDARAGGCT